MRILFLSNFYPPHSQGGYEQLCQEVAHLLAARGHTLCVLTGRTKSVPNVEEDGPVNVHRRLELELEGGLGHTVARLAFGGREASERRNIATVERVIDEFRPDVALIWGMWNVPRVVPATVERQLPTAYYICDYWPALPDAYIQRLQEPAVGVAGRWPKKLIASHSLPGLQAHKPVELAFRHLACASVAIRELLVTHDVPFGHAKVIRNGICISDYIQPARISPLAGRPLYLISAGRVTPDKGIMTAIEAIRLLVAEEGPIVNLAVYGSGDAGFLDMLQQQIALDELPITFYGFVPRAAMPGVLARGNVLLLPSIVVEALPRALLEAMAAGLTVIGTTTGGTGEVLVEGETGLTFQPGDAADLARQITRLAGDPALRERLAAAGQAVVLREFDIRFTVDQLEALLYRASAEHERQIA